MARLASDLGYQVTFVVDATATQPIPHRDAPAGQTVAELLADPRTLPADEVVRRTEYALAGRFATIATVAELEAAAVDGPKAAAVVAPRVPRLDWPHALALPPDPRSPDPPL